MQLTYWVAKTRTQPLNRNLRARTAEELQRLLESHPERGTFQEPEEVVIQFQDPFDLLLKTVDDEFIVQEGF